MAPSLGLRLRAGCWEMPTSTGDPGHPPLDDGAAMPHNLLVDVPMLTVVKTSAFARRAEKLLSTEEHEELVFFLALHPQSGDEIPGTGGVRKVRFAARVEGNPAACG